MSELLPCPFCNGAPRVGVSADFGYLVHSVTCEVCEASNHEAGCNTEAEAIAAWNTRAGEERAAREAVAAFAARLMAKVEERRKAAIFAPEDALRRARTGKIAWEKAEIYIACAAQWDEISDLLKDEAQHDS